LELIRVAEIRKDEVFMGRLTAAIGIVAIMVLNESEGANNHKQRLEWALASLDNPELMASRMFFQIVTDWKVAPLPDINMVSDDTLRGAVGNQLQITMQYSRLLR
jgi:hypothetical protein